MCKRHHTSQYTENKMTSTDNDNVPYRVVSDGNSTEHTTLGDLSHSSSSSHVLAYVLVPVGSIVLVALLALMVCIYM